MFAFGSYKLQSLKFNEIFVLKFHIIFTLPLIYLCCFVLYEIGHRYLLETTWRLFILSSTFWIYTTIIAFYNFYPFSDHTYTSLYMYFKLTTFFKWFFFPDIFNIKKCIWKTYLHFRSFALNILSSISIIYTI